MQQNLLLHLFCNKEKVKVKVFVCIKTVHHIIFGFSVIIDYRSIISAYTRLVKGLEDFFAVSRSYAAEEGLLTKGSPH